MAKTIFTIVKKVRPEVLSQTKVAAPCGDADSLLQFQFPLPLPVSVEEEKQFIQLIEMIDSKLSNGYLSGDWVRKRSHYEKQFCDAMGWVCVNQSDHDAVCTQLGNMKIEIKKITGAAWVNLSKYVDENPDRMHTTLVLLYRPGGTQIVDFLVIPTFRIKEKLVGNKALECKKALDLIKQVVPRSSENMVSLTKTDLAKLAI